MRMLSYLCETPRIKWYTCIVRIEAYGIWFKAVNPHDKYILECIIRTVKAKT